MAGSAEEYHDCSSYFRYKLGAEALDWPSQPDVFKTYPGLERASLPQVMAWPEEDLCTLLRDTPSVTRSDLDSDQISQIIMLTHSLTAKARYGGSEFYYRSVASAGALYPFELYVGVRDIHGLPDGLYHHSVSFHALTLLRSGNIMPILAESLGELEKGAPVAAFFLTSIFFRSSWKYRDRGYRYCLLDTGHLAENLTLALRALRLDFELRYDFNDEIANTLLRVNQSREVCLAIALVSGRESTPTGRTEELKASAKDLADASRVSPGDIDFPEITQIHSVSSTIVVPEQGAGRMLHRLGVEISETETLPKPVKWPVDTNYATAVFKRRSTRNFVPKELASDAFTGFLESLCPAVRENGDAQRVADSSVAVGFLSGNVRDLEPGFYLLDQEAESIGLVSSGSKIEKMAHVCLDQSWLANCSLHFLFLADLEALEATWGSRGYRYAMLTAGRMGQRIYLMSTSMRIGCCGIGAFYDDEAAQLLGLNERSRLLYLVGVGPLKKWSSF